MPILLPNLVTSVTAMSLSLDQQFCNLKKIILQNTLNSLGASLLLNIFLSFEVGIAHAIANFKWKENTSSLKN